MDFDPEIHTSKRETAKALKAEAKKREALEDRLEALEAQAEKDKATAASALEAEQAKTQAAQDAATKAAQDAQAATQTAFLVSKGITDPIDQADVLAAHTARGGDVALDAWLADDAAGTKDRSVARILATAGENNTDTGDGDQGTGGDTGKDGDVKTKPPKTNTGSQGTGTAGSDPKVLDNLGNLKTVAELRENRAAYLGEFMGEGYVAPSTTGQNQTLAQQAAALQASKG